MTLPITWIWIVILKCLFFQHNFCIKSWVPRNPEGTRVMLYEHVTFFSVCYPSWTINNNIYSPGAYSVGLKTLIECQDRCVENPNCVAIDHNYNDGNCWVHEKTSDLSTPIKWNDGNQYVLKNRCGETPPKRKFAWFISSYAQRFGECFNNIGVIHICSSRHAKRNYFIV